jgi:hypothetical protein
MDSDIMRLQKIEPTYEIFSDIKKMDGILDYTALSKAYMAKMEYVNKNEKMKIVYNLFYFAYLNLDLIKERSTYIDTMVNKIFELFADGMYELVCFVLYFTTFDKLTFEQKQQYNVALKKYQEKKSPKDNNFKFKEYEIFEYLSYDVEKFLIDVEYFPNNERIKEIFNLFVKYEKIIKKDTVLKESFKKAYDKTRNNLIRYCYLLL